MKKLILSLPALLLSAAVFAQAINDENAEMRTVKEFHAIKVLHGIDVYLSQGEKETVAASAAEHRFVSQVKMDVKDGVLTIWHDGGDIHHMYNRKMKLKVYISFVHLNDLDMGPASHAYAVGEWKDAELKKKLLKTMK